MTILKNDLSIFNQISNEICLSTVFSLHIFLLVGFDILYFAFSVLNTVIHSLVTIRVCNVPFSLENRKFSARSWYAHGWSERDREWEVMHRVDTTRESTKATCLPGYLVP